MSNPFQQPLKSIDEKLQRTLAALPAQVGAAVVNFSHRAWDEQGWTDETLEPWAPRKTHLIPTSADKKNVGRAILTQSGRLRNSIRVVATTADTVTIGTDVPYAQVHNEGFAGSVSVKSFSRLHTTAKIQPVRTIKGKSNKYTKFKTESTQDVKAHTKTMRITQRKFLGNSHQQTEEIKFLIEKQINKAFSLK